MKSKWYRGHIPRFWHRDEYKDLSYVRQPITPEEVNSWRDQGYDLVKSFTGVMYDNSNPMPDLCKRFTGIFNEYDNLTYTFYKMSTLEIMPTHVDHFRTYMKIFDVEYKNVVRILVMLEDWKPGHYLEIDGTGITSWIAGDYFIWDSDVPHAASNIGTEDRYTLQITGTKRVPDDIWARVHWYNIPGLDSKPESTSDSLLKYRILPYLEYNNSKPLYIYMLNEKIKELEEIEHDAHNIQIMNEKGIDIYLYEPVSGYLVGSEQYYPPAGTKHSMIFYSEFPDNVKVNMMRADELDSIQLYALKNGLTNITVHTCDYDIEKYFPHYKGTMNLVCDDLFLKTVSPINVVDDSYSYNFTRRFISLNWRWTPHRHLIAAYLAPLSSYITWYYRGDMTNFTNQPWCDIILWGKSNPDAFSKLLKGFEYLNKHSPFNIDLKIEQAVNIIHPYWRDPTPKNQTIFDARKGVNVKDSTKIESCYRDIFVDVVTESRYAQPTANYSEKTLQPMFFKKSFILVAPPFTLKYLREQGFQTFSDFWDESYDECVDHERRMWMIFNLIDEIENTPIDDLRELYKAMQPVLQHNYERLLDTVLAEDQS